MLVDSHCHIDFPELSGQLDAVPYRTDALFNLAVPISCIYDRVKPFLP